MEVKKSPQADLENKKNIFLEIGLMLALGTILFAFEWKVSGRPKCHMAKHQVSCCIRTKSAKICSCVKESAHIQRRQQIGRAHV